MPAIDTTTAPEGALQTHESVTLVRRARPHVGWGAIAVALGFLAVLLLVSLLWARVDPNKSFISPSWATTDANASFEPYSYYGGHGVTYGGSGSSDQDRLLATRARTAPRVDASTADAIYPVGLMTNAKNLPEAHYTDYTLLFN